MKRRLLILAGTGVAGAAWAQVPKIDELVKGLGKLQKTPSSAPDEQSSAAGIKEALAIGVDKAVASLSRKDGYFANAAVKILMPDRIRKVADVARKVGFQRQVDEFVLSMNRAAESAAPLASRHFADAIREMSLSDARAIVTGGETSATDYFSGKTRDKLYGAFKPVVARQVGEVGATRAYKNLMDRYEKVPLVGRQSVDLDDYVTNKSLDGLFHMVAQEEKAIRSNPAARTTELLKKVFGRS
ncbi:MAG: DUF4197 domain-containing protein [Leptothrix sp. (in: Bacteria)]|nr:DUF4197 domain-containing protein [Leptothrix sp. (in: b-proteobacteria)]